MRASVCAYVCLFSVTPFPLYFLQARQTPLYIISLSRRDGIHCCCPVKHGLFVSVYGPGGVPTIVFVTVNYNKRAFVRPRGIVSAYSFTRDYN